MQGPLLDVGRNPCVFPCVWLYRQGILSLWTRNRWHFFFAYKSLYNRILTFSVAWVFKFECYWLSTNDNFVIKVVLILVLCNFEMIYKLQIVCLINARCLESSILFSLIYSQVFSFQSVSIKWYFPLINVAFSLIMLIFLSS